MAEDFACAGVNYLDRISIYSSDTVVFELSHTFTLDPGI